MKANLPEPNSYVYFVDAHSLLSIATGADSQTASDVLSFEASACKAGNSTDVVALGSASFKLELPSIFGTDGKTAAVDKNSRVLPGVKSAEAWDPQNAFTGAWYYVENAIEEATGTMNSSVSVLPSHAHIVATAMIQASSQFLEKLCKWITLE